MKQLFLIRHAKSSWAVHGLDDFDRPLSKRGKADGLDMANRLAEAGVQPDLIVASPAKRAKKTARMMAKATGYKKKKINYYDQLYLGTLPFHLQLIEQLFRKVDSLFLVGHNDTLTELAEYLTGRRFGNVPTCGIVAVEYPQPGGFSCDAGAGKLLFFDFPKNSNATVMRI